MRSETGLRVVVLEDDRRNVEAIADALRRADPACDVLHVTDQRSFASALEEFGPDVVISGHSVGGATSLDMLRITQAQRPLATFLIVSERYEPSVTETLKSGAADFVRRADIDRLGSAIYEALRRRAPLRALSHRQLQVLRLLAEGGSTRGIAAALGVSAKTVETHRAHLMRRLGIHDVAGLVRFAIGAGLVPPLT